MQAERKGSAMDEVSIAINWRLVLVGYLLGVVTGIGIMLWMFGWK